MNKYNKKCQLEEPFTGRDWLVFNHFVPATGVLCQLVPLNVPGKTSIKYLIWLMNYDSVPLVPVISYLLKFKYVINK